MLVVVVVVLLLLVLQLVLRDGQGGGRCEKNSDKEESQTDKPKLVW